jgi:hypothetical protein
MRARAALERGGGRVAIEIHCAHPVNQKLFHDDLTSWVYGAAKDADSPLAAFYFEAFDEPWKGAWGDDYAEADAVYYRKP